MRHRTVVLAACLLILALAAPAAPAAAKKAAPKPEPGQASGEAVVISGRVAVGLDKAFVKDSARGYCMIQGADLTRHAGRLVEARGVLVGREQDYLVVRVTEFRVRNPDDDSPGAGGAVRAGGAAPPRRKK